MYFIYYQREKLNSSDSIVTDWKPELKQKKKEERKKANFKLYFVF